MRTLLSPSRVRNGALGLEGGPQVADEGVEAIAEQMGRRARHRQHVGHGVLDRALDLAAVGDHVVLHRREAGGLEHGVLAVG